MILSIALQIAKDIELTKKARDSMFPPKDVLYRQKHPITVKFLSKCHNVIKT